MSSNHTASAKSPINKPPIENKLLPHIKTHNQSDIERRVKTARSIPHPTTTVHATRRYHPLALPQQTRPHSVSSSYGVTQEDRAEVQQPVDVDHHSITKFAIVRNVLTKVNTRGDNGLPARCDIVKRIAEFENFELC